MAYMSKELKVNAILLKNSEYILKEKLKTYNLGKEFNYAVAVIKLLIINSQHEKKENLEIELIPKVQFVTPFVTRKLANDYCKELSTQNKIMMLLNVENGKIIAKNEDVESALDSLELSGKENTDVSKNMSPESYFYIVASTWNQNTEEQKDAICFQLGGIKNCQDIKDMFDNWEF
jgi:hypothetical protein